MRFISFISFISLFLAGCSLNTGPHVTYNRIEQPSKLVYECMYSDHWYSQDRRIAICEDREICNSICEKLNK